MTPKQAALAQTCLDGAGTGAMSFPQIVGALMQEGFESYAIDFRCAVATYYLPDGDSLQLPTHDIETPVAERFDVGPIKAAIGEAQQQAQGYTYEGFCKKVAAAGCAGYLVSLLVRRAVYIGRTGETHVEHFPQ
ncbi:MAG: DUF1398 family protein [Proteobacteria bacterium]|nr:DUF1398 family protein [Pseudomonadota bacterium]